MDNITKNVVTDQEIYVDGLTLREKRELITETRGNLRVATLIHTRWIGDDVYQVISISQNGVVETKVKTELSPNEVENFEATWQEKWNPRLSDGAGTSSATAVPTPSNCPICEESVCRCAELMEEQSQHSTDWLTEQESNPYSEQPCCDTCKVCQCDPCKCQAEDANFKKTFVTDQELVVDGVHLRDRRELKDLDTEGNSLMIHTRWIDGKKYQVTRTLNNGQEVETKVNTKMAEEDIRGFEKEWEEKWNPQLATASQGTTSYENVQEPVPASTCDVCNEIVCRCSTTRFEDIKTGERITNLAANRTEEPITEMSYEDNRTDEQKNDHVTTSGKDTRSSNAPTPGPLRVLVADIKKTFVTDQELTVDGIHLRDRRELSDLDDGNNSLIHTRWIGDQQYQVTKIVNKDNVVKEQVDTKMSSAEVEKFESTWNEK